MFKRMLKNWKSTLSGAATLALVGVRIAHGNFDYETDGPLILLGLGQIAGKDANVTGGTKPQDGGTIPQAPSQRPPSTKF